jgi:uncharacterized protein (TIGR03000 family)
MSRYTFTILSALVLAVLLPEMASAQSRGGRGGGGARGGAGGFRLPSAGGFRGAGYTGGVRGAGVRGAAYGRAPLYGPAGLTAYAFQFGGGYGYGRGGYFGWTADYLDAGHGGYYYPDDFGNLPPVPDEEDDVPPVPDSAQPEAPTDNTARIHVVLPAGAQLWFEGKATTRRGAKRDFYSPKLTPGKNYLYNITARWIQNGRWVEQKGEFSVRANETTIVRFPLPDDTLPPPRVQEDKPTR